MGCVEVDLLMVCGWRNELCFVEKDVFLLITKIGFQGVGFYFCGYS